MKVLLNFIPNILLRSFQENLILTERLIFSSSQFQLSYELEIFFSYLYYFLNLKRVGEVLGRAANYLCVNGFLLKDGETVASIFLYSLRNIIIEIIGIYYFPCT